MSSSSDHDHHNNPDPVPTRLYNPYQDLQVPIQNLYKLPTSPEFLFVEEARRQRRSWDENLTFYTGCTYLAGAIGGGSAGLVSGVRSFESGDTTKLKITRILNSFGHSGRVWANRLGVIGRRRECNGAGEPSGFESQQVKAFSRCLRAADDECSLPWNSKLD